MEIDNKYPSPLKMENLSIINANLKYTPGFKSGKLRLDVRKSIVESQNSKYIVTIYTEIHDVDNKVVISVTCSADFSVTAQLPDDLDKKLIDKNSIAIMFPYVRSYISIITSIPNMMPIVLPPININKLIEDQENSERN